MSETKMHEGGMIARSNRFFAQISRIGEMDEKGKTIFSIGFKRTRVANPDRPLALMVGFIHNYIVTKFNYSSAEEAAKDIAIFKAYAEGLYSDKPTEKSQEGADEREGKSSGEMAGRDNF